MLQASVLNQQGININRAGEWLKVGRTLVSEPYESVCLHISEVSNERVLICARIWNGEHHPVAKQIRFQPGSLEACIVIDEIESQDGVEPQAGLATLLYLALREGRIFKRSNALFLLHDNEQQLIDLLKLHPLTHVPPIGAPQGVVKVYTQRIDYAMFHAFAACTGQWLELVQNQMTTEVVRTVEAWLGEFFQRPWAQSIFTRTITRQQYVSTWFNLHTFVRYTTRLLGRAVALSSDGKLRDHYIEHLKGEINHERIIERDLEYLGEDVDYLRNFYQPNYETKAFLAVQESTLAFYQDPVLFLACPIAAEGVAAYLTKEFLACLYDSVESWGIEQPKRAAHMATSHAGFDGGEDGHWNMTIERVGEYVKTEARLREFLGVLRSAMNALERSYDANLLEMRIWEPLKV